MSRSADLGLRMRIFVGLLLLLAGAAVAAEDPQALEIFAPAPGPAAVGLRIVNQYDYGRTYRQSIDSEGQIFTGERARPIQTLIWYPAEVSRQAHLTLGDYVALEATEEGFSPTAARIAAARHDASNYGVAARLKTWAIRDAVPASGQYPIVIYAPSFSASAFENLDLCEYLASHGYIVIASPSLGPHTRGMLPDSGGLDARSGIEAQAADISFLIGFARLLPQADLSRVAVVGYSWGGLSNLFAAARDSRISALVFLDGSARYFPGLVAGAGDVHPRELTIPALYVTSRDPALEDLSQSKNQFASPNVLTELTHSDLTILHMRGMAHEQFSSVSLRDATDSAFNPAGEYSRSEVLESYRWMTRYTLAFLDARLKGDSVAAAFMQHNPLDNGVPNHLAWLDRRPSKGPPASLQELQRLSGAQGFAHLNELYAGMRKQAPDYQPHAYLLRQWADELSLDGQRAKAIEVLKFTLSLYPDNAGAQTALTELMRK